MKSRNALRKRRDATRIEWTPAVAGASHLIRIRFALAMVFTSSSLGFLVAHTETQCSLECLFKQFALSFHFKQFVFAICIAADFYMKGSRLRIVTLQLANAAVVTAIQRIGKSDN